jgi:glyoxylase-like metal-dependent hydrolase (beta-lactamase superfamily II)
MRKEMIHEIGKDFFLIKSDEKDFHRNIYLKRFVGPDGSSINMICDPGTRLDIGLVVGALKDLVGGIENIHLVFLSHQDPDLTSNINVFLTGSPSAKIVCSIDTWRLVRMYGIDDKRYYAVENFKSKTLKIGKTGHRIQFVPAQFCHFRGAMMFYDFESGILFSGDLLGGINTRKGTGIYATEESWSGISIFHQLYMPSTDALRETVQRIGLLNPIPDIIAPQHGDVIKGNLVVEFLTRLLGLEVGFDVIKKEEPQKEIFLSAINSFLDFVSAKYPAVHEKLLEELKKTGTFTTIFIVAGASIIDIKVRATEAVGGLWDAIKRISGPGDLSELKTMLVQSIDDAHVKIDPSVFGSSGRETAEEAIVDG